MYIKHFLKFILGKNCYALSSVLYGYLGPARPFLGAVLSPFSLQIRLCLKTADRTQRSNSIDNLKLSPDEQGV